MEAPVPPSESWAKLAPRYGESQHWHPLQDHCADVAACAEALLSRPIVRVRLAAMAGLAAFPEVWAARLAVLAFLHDFGKANLGFQHRTAGHIHETAFVACNSARRCEFGLDVLDSFGPPTDFLLAVALAHHGEPPDLANPGQDDRKWQTEGGRDPLATVKLLVAFARGHWPDAFPPILPLPEPQSPFWHTFLGLLQLADWLGSDSAHDAFPFSEVGDGSRFEFARDRSKLLLTKIGFDVTEMRASLPGDLDFNAVSSHVPTDIQRAAAEAPGPIVVLEAETGSGKTEAALWRFVRLFAEGRVDGLYFALPTRVAASQIHGRVLRAMRRLLGKAAPDVVRALPGDALAGEASVRRLPDFKSQWSDDPEEIVRRARWAAEHPKRFLAAPLAVGTIDQALLGAVRVKHAQMRSFCLSRSLLVVDEVHASDVYMEKLLIALLDQHRAAGGHALLLSATLGAAARSRLLLGERKAKKKTPSPADAVTLAYPALSWVNDDLVVTVGKHGRGQVKSVMVEPSDAISNPTEVACLALAAAERGAKVLVVRNLVRDAVATACALHVLAPDHPALFRLDGVATLHHGRFARVDRRRLDGAVEREIGHERPAGPLVLIGTQTLEQSLDIDADLLITDLAPMDVLLQRIGRLHRHDRDGQRPKGFDAAKAIVLTPFDFDASLAAVTRDRNGPHGLGGLVYGNLVSLAATRERIGGGAAWTIPSMNRELVEAATHPVTLEALKDRLAARDERWEEIWRKTLGTRYAQGQAADLATIDWKQPVSDFRIAEDRIGTRLGLGDIEIALPPQRGPFSNSPPIERIVIPAHLIGGVRADAEPVDILQEDDGFSFRLSDRTFSYRRYGLERV